MSEQRVFDFPLTRWNQIVDWLEAQKNPDASSAALFLVLGMNNVFVVENQTNEKRFTLATHAGDVLDIQVSAAVAATEPQPE